MANSVDENLQVVHKKAHTAACNVAYNFIEQVLLDLLSRKLMYKIPEKHTAKYLDTINTADKVGKNPISTNALMLTVSAFIQHKTSEAVAAERVATKTEKRRSLRQ